MATDPATHIQRRREAFRRFMASDKGRLVNRRAVAKYRANPANLAKEQARRAVKLAVKAHRLPRARDLPCSKCGNQADGYHHHRGYSPGHRLDVVPMCKICHKTAEGQGLGTC